jgi:hypothetical protein
MEVATTNDDGYPSALRITITNVSEVPVDMPVLQKDCSPDNGFRIEASWTSDDGEFGPGRGFGCRSIDQPGLMNRVQREWVRLRPGEWMTQTERLDWSDYLMGGRSGTVEYWVEYWPPILTSQDTASLSRASYNVSTQKLVTPHASFHIR